MKFSIKQKLNSLINKSKRIYKVNKYNLTRKSSKKVISNEQGLKTIISNIRLNTLFFKGLVIVLSSIFLFFIIENIYFYVSLNISKYPADNNETVPWDGYRRINIMFIGLDKKETGYTFVDRVIILYINPDTPKLGIFSVNTNFESTLPNKTKASIKLSYKYGLEFDEPLEYTIVAVENLLGITIDRYIVSDTDQVFNILESINLPNLNILTPIKDVDFPPIEVGNYAPDANMMYLYLASDALGEDAKMERLVNFFKDYIEGFSNPLSIFSMRTSIEAIAANTFTNISKLEFFHLGLFLTSIRTDQIKIAYTREDAATKSQDIFSIWMPIIQNIDKDLSSIFINPNVKLEQAKVEIMNGTDIQGLANKKARLLRNLGCRIVRIGNSTRRVDKSYLYVLNPENYKETINEIKSVFNDEIVILREEYPFRHIGDLVVVVGE